MMSVAKLFGYNGYIELNALTIGTIAIAFIDERSENTTSQITYGIGLRSNDGGTINIGDSNTNSMNTITVMEIAT